MAGGGYKIVSSGGKFNVVNGIGIVKKSFADRAAAVEYMKKMMTGPSGAKMPPWMNKPAKAAQKRAKLDSETLARLAANYRIERVEPAAAPGDTSPGYDAETEVIRQNKMMPQSQMPHRFSPGEFTQPGGGPRCLMCGQDEPITGVCFDDGTAEPVPQGPPAKIPVAASERAYIVTSIGEQAPRLANPEWIPSSRGFVTELNGKTLITAQATVDPALFEKALTPNEYFLWTQGRLVGADEPNRNGAFWTSGDLELGQATVKYGPLNWLHNGKHVIGTLAEGAFVAPQTQDAAEGFTQPHIAVVAPVWKWLYPDEAEVIQMASEAGKFWYSMECVSKTVQCVGDGGCGAEAAYMDYVRNMGASCEHMKARSTTRRFVDPNFLGAAVIVPPVRPGWANANANTMKQAAGLAEKAFEQAGRPEVSASDWELLMAQVVGYAGA